MKKNILILISFLFSLQAFSQINSDSLWAVWNDSAQPHTNRLEAMGKIAKAYETQKPDSALYFGQLQYQLADSVSNKTWMAKSMDFIGQIYGRKSDFTQAMDYFTRSLALFEEIGDKAGTGEPLNHIGIINNLQGNYPEAKDYYEHALKIFEEFGDKAGTAKALDGIGSLYLYQGDTSQAMDYFTRSLKVCEEMGDQVNIATPLANIGRVYLSQGNTIQAIDYYIRALKILEKTGDTYRILYVLPIIGNMFYRQGDTTQALEYYTQAMNMAEEYGEKTVLGNMLGSIGNIYRDQRKYARAMEYYIRAFEILEETGDKRPFSLVLINIGRLYQAQGDYVQAMDYFTRSLKLSEEIAEKSIVALSLTDIGNIYAKQGDYVRAISFGTRSLARAREAQLADGIRAAAKSLYESYKGTGQYRKSLEMHELFIQMRDSIKNDENQKAVVQQKYQYEYEKKALADSLSFVKTVTDTEIAYQAELAQRNYLLFGGLGLALLGFIFFRYRQRLRNREQELELQSERERTEQLAALDTMKSRFFANISHEFRTPLTLVLGQNQNLQARLDDPVLDPQFDMVDRNGRRLLELINQVLDLSKLESDKLSLKTETFDIVFFLKNILFSFESIADQKQQKLHFAWNQSWESLLITADPEKLERVIYNLLANAVKFTPEKGQITLQLQMIAHRVHIGVIDTGIGIEADQLPHIFDRFYQAEGDENQPAPGTGIGLALAKELVELHQGELSVTSEAGKGSSFWVNLPLTSEIDDQALSVYTPKLDPLQVPLMQAEVLPANSSDKGEQILIVEDNPDVRSYLQTELQGFGYRVIQAEDGIVGLEQATIHQPDLIISDVMMPRMDGFAFAQAIRNDANSSHIPLILLTAKASDESRITGLETGVDDYLTKPFNSKELRARIINLIEQRKHLRQRFSEAINIRPEEVSAVPMDQEFLQKITSCIEDNLGNEQFGVDTLADTVGMSVSNLNRKLNALLGQTAGKLIRSMRLRRAAELLSQKAAPVTQIAYEVGFHDPTSFARSFKRQFGVAPSAYGKDSR